MTPSPAVDSQHPLYKRFAPVWRMVADCVAGPSAIRQAGPLYLPKFHLQKPAAYAAYIKRAKFFNATKRTLQAFIGFIFNKNPDWKLPKTADMVELTKDATMTGESLYDWSKRVVGKTASLGRIGTLVDWAPEPEDRAYISTYEWDDIRNWGYRRVAGRTVLSFLTLLERSNEWMPEPGEVTRPDAFTNPEWEQWRVYRLVGPDDAPFVQVDVWRRRGSVARSSDGTGPAAGGEFRLVDQKFPDRRGEPLRRIPFVFHGPAGGHGDPKEVPMEDIAEVNLSHWRGSASLANARNAAGVPTPFIFGLSQKEADKEIHLGTSECMVSTNKDAKAGFMSYGGEGLASLEKGIEEDERQMAALGASMLDRQGGGSGGKNAEAFETVQLRMAGTTSALVAIVIACSQTCSDVLQWLAWWQKTERAAEPEDLDETVGVEFGTEFLNLVMDSGMLGALMGAYISKGMSYQTLFWNLQKAGLVPSEKTITKEIAEIENSPITLPGALEEDGSQPPKTKAKKDAKAKDKKKAKKTAEA